MANEQNPLGINDDRQGANVLRSLLMQIGQSFSQAPQNLAKLNQKAGQAIASPIEALAKLAGTASIAPADDLLTDAAKKKLVKLQDKQLEEAVAEGVPLENLQQQVEQRQNVGATKVNDFGQPKQPTTPTSASPATTTQAQTQPQQQQVKPNTNTTAMTGEQALKGLMDFLVTPGSIDEKGIAKPGKLLGGLIQEHPRNTLLRQQAQTLPKELALKEKKINKDIELASSQEARLSAVAEKDLFNAKREVYKIAQEITPKSFWNKTQSPEELEKIAMKLNDSIQKMKITQGRVEVDKTVSKVKDKITGINKSASEFLIAQGAPDTPANREALIKRGLVK